MLNVLFVVVKCIKVIGGYFSFIKINFHSSHFIKGNFDIKKNEFEKGVIQNF